MKSNQKNKDGFQNYLIAAVMLVSLCMLAVAGRAKIVEKDVDLPSVSAVSPDEFEAVRASIIDKEPSRYTIDVRKFANVGVDEDAEFYALYTQQNLPGQCGDFRNLELPYSKPDKYKRVFNLSDHDDVLKAIDAYGCIVVRNSG